MLTRKLKTIYSQKLDELFASGYFDGGKQEEIHLELLDKMDETSRTEQIQKEEEAKKLNDEKDKQDAERRARQSKEEKERITLELKDLVTSACSHLSSGKLVPEITHVGFFEKAYFSDFYYIMPSHNIIDEEKKKVVASSIKWADKQISYHFILKVFDDVVDAGGIIVNKSRTQELIVFRSEDARIAPVIFRTKPIKDLYTDILVMIAEGQEQLDEHLRRFELTQSSDVKFSRDVNRLKDNAWIEFEYSDEQE